MFTPIRLLSSAILLRAVNICGTDTMTSGGKVCNSRRVRYLTQAEAIALDEDLFNEYKFSVDQLMELAGLSVATAVARAYPPTSHNSALVVCGPGNNGGDGLVAARHMALFGYNVSVYYPKRTAKPLYINLFEQCQKFGVNILQTLPVAQNMQDEYNVLVDALFGFSFKPPVRVELKPVLDLMIDAKIPVCSVDIPSGWDVEKGPDLGPGNSYKVLRPSTLVSLSAPKLCARPDVLLQARHYLGGRFLPPDIISKYNLTLPPYPGEDQIVLLSC